MPRPPRQAPPYDGRAIRSLLIRQDGLVTRSQLIECGATPSDLACFVRRHQLFRRSPGVFSETNGTLTPRQKARFACLHYGRAALIDRSSLEMARATDGSRLTFPLQIGVASHRGPAALPGVTLSRVARLGELVAWHASPPRMWPHHAALRAAAAQADDDARVTTLVAAINWRTTKVDRVLESLAQHPRLAHREFLAEVLADLAAGACSVLEREYLHRVERAHGLPRGRRQEPRRSASGVEFRDVTYEEQGLVVELDGRAFHSGKHAWDRDHARDLDELVAGRDTARLGWSQIFGTACDTAGKIGLVLRARGWRGLPHPCGDGCRLHG